MNTLVSIITPAYNSSQFIRETIESFIAQTYSNWELLVTDDCSTDNTWEILKEYAQKDNRIKIFRLDKNSGAGIARNNSIKHASGKYIAFCDSDDLWLPEKLDYQVKFMEDNNYDFSFASCEMMTEAGKFLYTKKVKPIMTYKKLLRNDYIPCLTAMYNSESLGKIFMPEVRKRQDWGLWLKILKKTKFAFGIEKSLALYKVRNKSLSRNKISLLKHNWNIYKQVEGFSTIKSCLLMLQFLFFYFLYKVFRK
jgi:glycosyltransferase involved in cell wall biosynthesis